MTFIFDLDGTLIDSSERMYQLFKLLVPDSTLSKAEYWEKKRNKINHQLLLETDYPHVDYSSFNQLWLKQIETQKYLELDKCFNDTLYVLDILKQKHSLILLTARQNKVALQNELITLGLNDFFNSILVTEHVLSKGDLLEILLKKAEVIQSQTYYVSDMGSDIQLGNSYGLKTIAITHGFMNAKHLLSYNPDYLIDELSDILVILNTIKC